MHLNSVQDGNPKFCSRGIPLNYYPCPEIIYVTLTFNNNDET